MARKYDLISELYNRTCKTVVSNPQNWQAFLASACRNYKLRYDEQLLVYAQRPDATAVLEIEQWNKIFGRWVNRGARGIAVFADENRSRQRLTHYFDISDTHESRYSRTVPIWDMRQEYEADVIETLESTFGEIENKSSLAEAIMGAARNAAEDNIPDYLQDLYYATEGSSFEEVEEDIVAFIYKNVVTNSVAYMMMSRLGVDTDGYFELDDFRDVTNFNTQETLNALGFATSDIAEMGLTEISKTITALNRQNRIIVGQDRNEYNKVENNDERSLDDERTDLHDGGRLQPSEPETSTAAGSDAGQVRSDEERVSEGTSQSPLLQSPDEGRTDTALGGSGTESQQDGRNNPEPDGTERGSDRADESRSAADGAVLRNRQGHLCPLGKGCSGSCCGVHKRTIPGYDRLLSAQCAPNAGFLAVVQRHAGTAWRSASLELDTERCDHGGRAARRGAPLVHPAGYSTESIQGGASANDRGFCVSGKCSRRKGRCVV